MAAALRFHKVNIRYSYGLAQRRQASLVSIFRSLIVDFSANAISHIKSN